MIYFRKLRFTLSPRCSVKCPSSQSTEGLSHNGKASCNRLLRPDSLCPDSWWRDLISCADFDADNNINIYLAPLDIRMTPCTFLSNIPPTTKLWNNCCVLSFCKTAWRSDAFVENNIYYNIRCHKLITTYYYCWRRLCARFPRYHD